MSEEDLWNELCLCILSSNVLFETAKSAFLQLQGKGLLTCELRNGLSRKEIVKELSRPIFMPRRRDGSFRKYRFSKRRSKDLVKAHAILYGKNEGLHLILRTFSSDSAARSYFVDNIPGIGLKQASHFLRNVKFSSRLAIVDSHVARFLQGFNKGKNDLVITPSNYTQFERSMLEISNQYGLNPAILDMVIWSHMRGDRLSK
jgi:N-glycosylase/DNA lyase